MTLANNGAPPPTNFDWSLITPYEVTVADDCDNESLPATVDVSKISVINPYAIVIRTDITPSVVVAGGYNYPVINASLYSDTFTTNLTVIDSTGTPIAGDPGTLNPASGATTAPGTPLVLRNANTTLTTPPPVAAPGGIDVRITLTFFNEGGSNCSRSRTHDFNIQNMYP